MESNKLENKSTWFVASGIIASIVASFCCVGPLILTLLGVSGAAVFTKFEVIRIPMIVLVFTLFGVSGFTLYRKRQTCEPGSICADPKKFKKMIMFYWVGLVLAILGISSPQWVAWLFS